MPNPYTGNDRAAAFVEYYASDRMLAGAVNRLYSGGMARQQQARVEAEREAYPERYQPPVRRTQAEIEQYLQNRVESELLRRQQHRAALQQELYPESQASSTYMKKKDLERQVNRLYRESMRQRRAREEQLERVFGRNKSEDELLLGDRSPREIAELKEREAGWRPPSASVPHTEDNRLTLSSQYDYYANPAKFTEVFVTPKQPRPMSREERALQMKRLTDLARPLSVTPKRVDNVRDPDAPPPFYVDRRVIHEDEPGAARAAKRGPATPRAQKGQAR